MHTLNGLCCTEGHRFDARRDVTTVCSVDPARQLAATAILHHKSSRHRPIYLFFVGNNGTHFIREKIRESFLHSCRYGIVDNVTQAWENSFPEINSPAHSSCSFVLENLATNSVKWPNPQRTASSDHFDGGESNDGRRSARRKRDEPIRRTTDTNSLSLPTPTPTLTPDVHYYPSESLQSYDAYPLVVMHSAPITAENGHLGELEKRVCTCENHDCWRYFLNGIMRQTLFTLFSNNREERIQHTNRMFSVLSRSTWPFCLESAFDRIHMVIWRNCIDVVLPENVFMKFLSNVGMSVIYDATNSFGVHFTS